MDRPALDLEIAAMVSVSLVHDLLESLPLSASDFRLQANRQLASTVATLRQNGVPRTDASRLTLEETRRRARWCVDRWRASSVRHPLEDVRRSDNLPFDDLTTLHDLLPTEMSEEWWSRLARSTAFHGREWTHSKVYDELLRDPELLKILPKESDPYIGRTEVLLALFERIAPRDLVSEVAKIPKGRGKKIDSKIRDACFVSTPRRSRAKVAEVSTEPAYRDSSREDIERAIDVDEIKSRMRKACGPTPGLKGARKRADAARACQRQRAFDVLLQTASIAGVATAVGLAPSNAHALVLECECLIAERAGIRFSHRDL